MLKNPFSVHGEIIPNINLLIYSQYFKSITQTVLALYRLLLKYTFLYRYIEIYTNTGKT